MREGDTVNVFDRAVAAVAPVHAAKRAAARAALKIIDSGYGNYGANLTKKSLRGWEFYGGSAKEDIEDNIDILRQRSRDAYMGIPTASAALKTMRTNVIAGGLMPAPQIDAEFLGLTPEDAEKLQAQIVREFALWADTPVCDADRVDNFYKLQQLTFLSYAMNGDAIVLLPTKEQTGQPYSLRVRLVEADRVCSPDGFDRLVPCTVQGHDVHTFFRDTFFTNVKKSTTERVDIDLVKGDRRMAAFVHPRVGGKVLKASGYKTESYKPPLVNPCDITTADRYMTRMPGEDLYSGETPAQRSAQQLMEEYSRLNDATTRREEWMAVQAIVTGQVPVVGEGVNEIIDFGFTNTETLTGTAQWGKSAAKISDNLEDWADKVLTNGFANVDMAIMGKTALRNFLADEKISKMLDNRRVEMGLIHPRDLPNGVKYVGHLNSPNIDIYTYAEVYLDDWTDPAAPKTLPLVPENKVVLIASHPDYMMAYGACTYIEDSTQQWVTAQTDRLLRSFVKHQPDRRMLELQARPLPIPDKVDSWFVATVC